MLIWIGAAVLTALAVGTLVGPLLRETDAVDGDTASDADIAVYRDQLREIDQDLARGLIGDPEAEAARAELGRRLLRRQDEITAIKAGDTNAASVSSAPSAKTNISQMAVYGVAVLLPLASLSIYLTKGRPTLPSQPHAERLARDPAKSSVNELVARVEERLRKNPNEGRGWEILAPVYLKQRRFEDAANAFQRALQLLGKNERRLLGYAEARVLSQDGLVTADARQAFQDALDLNANLVEPQFWLAIAQEQSGDLAGAVRAYEILLGKGEKEAAWRRAVEERLQAARRNMDGVGSNKPSIEDANVTPSINPTEMVKGLADKLKQNPKNLEDWLRLIQSYSTLDQPGEVQKATEQARKVFAQDAAALSKIENLIKTLEHTGN